MEVQLLFSLQLFLVEKNPELWNLMLICIKLQKSIMYKERYNLHIWAYIAEFSLMRYTVPKDVVNQWLSSRTWKMHRTFLAMLDSEVEVELLFQSSICFKYSSHPASILPASDRITQNLGFFEYPVLGISKVMDEKCYQVLS